MSGECSENGCKFFIDDQDTVIGEQLEMFKRGFTKLRPDAKIPKRATEQSAGYDFSIPENADPVTIKPHEIKLIPTGIAAFMQPHEYLDLRIRSGLSRKGLIFMNGSGVIDADYYPNDVGAIVCNLSEQEITLNPGDRIAQGIFTEYLRVLEEDAPSAQRTGGYGSTGGISHE